MERAANCKNKFVNYNEIQTIKREYKNYFNKFITLLNTTNKRNQFKKIGDFLTVVLRVRYDGFTGYQYIKTINTFRGVVITIDFVELLLKQIDSQFSTVDAKALIALATHRNASYSFIDCSYPTKMQKLYKAINIEINSSSLNEISDRVANDIYYVDYIIEEFYNNQNIDKMDLIIIIIKNLQLIQNTNDQIQKYIISLITNIVSQEIMGEIIKIYQYPLNSKEDLDVCCHICLDNILNKQNVIKLYTNEQNYILYHSDCIYKWFIKNFTDPITKKLPRFTLST